MDSKNFAIGVLSTTAVILLVGVLIIHSQSSPARAAGMTTEGGKYVMTVGAIEPAEDLVFVINATAQKMIIYRFDVGRSRIVRVERVDLKKMVDKSAASAKKKGKGKKRGRRP
ncbi:MAG: hypothetical protein IIB57_07755 [Planctomycetes bacterium]|nr:hypothetical protein [Planctomycetota bacterium]